MARYKITIGNHRCRPIESDDWRMALSIAVERVYGGRAWTPSISKIRNGHGYIEIAKRARRNSRRSNRGSTIVDHHVEVTVQEESA